MRPFGLTAYELRAHKGHARAPPSGLSQRKLKPGNTPRGVRAVIAVEVFLGCLPWGRLLLLKATTPPNLASEVKKGLSGCVLKIFGAKTIRGWHLKYVSCGSWGLNFNSDTSLFFLMLKNCGRRAVHSFWIFKAKPCCLELRKSLNQPIRLRRLDETDFSESRQRELFLGIYSVHRRRGIF